MEVITIGLPKEERACRVTRIEIIFVQLSSRAPLSPRDLTNMIFFFNFAHVLDRVTFLVEWFSKEFLVDGSLNLRCTSTFARLLLLDREMPRDTNVPNSLWDFGDSLEKTANPSINFFIRIAAKPFFCFYFYSAPFGRCSRGVISSTIVL